MTNIATLPCSRNPVSTMCHPRFAALPFPKLRNKNTRALVSPFHHAAFGCGHSPQRFRTWGERQPLASVRSPHGDGLENVPATILGTTGSAPYGGKGTEYAEQFCSLSGQELRSSPKAERAELWSEMMTIKRSDLTSHEMAWLKQRARHLGLPDGLTVVEVYRRITGEFGGAKTAKAWVVAQAARKAPRSKREELEARATALIGAGMRK